MVRAITSAITRASACCSSLSGPELSRNTLRAPMRAAPIRTGKPKTARAPASRASGVKAGQRGVVGAARSGSAITVPVR